VERARHLLAMLLEDYDRVVLTSPAVAQSPSALVWSHVVDATVVVLRRGKSRREVVVEAVRAFELAGARVAGAVLRDSPRRGIRG